MSNDFDSIILSINKETARIAENQLERTRRYNHCLDSYLDHLRTEIRQLDSTEEQNDHRNELISSAFENVYDRIMTSSQVCLRKIKETCYEKKEFWDSLIKNNAELEDLDLKKDFYQQKRDAKERYEDAIENQKTKKMSYELLLGKLKHKNNLKEWQENNKQLEQQVTKGTKTMKEWNIVESKPRAKVGQGTYSATAEDSDFFLHQFTQSNAIGRPPLYVSRREDSQEGNILSNFQYRK